ncbi:MAG TPA: serine O-acetyltransferase [Coriobacteriia bacterium]|nr:serine O-acetyltransferase [Coriobacteriia bacterium]
MFKKLREDIRAVKASDPAATSSITIFFCYPGIQATAAHRFENWLWRHGRRGIARFLSQVTRFFTGIEIHPGATLGRRVFIDHGMGVIIGETAVVADDVTIFQGVTLGGTGKEHGKRHPNVDEGAVIGVGASVLGNITIGARSKVGGGAVVVDNVPEDCTVVGIPGRVVWQNGMRICPADPHRRDLMPDPLEMQIEELLERVAQLEEHTKELLGAKLEAELTPYSGTAPVGTEPVKRAGELPIVEAKVSTEKAVAMKASETEDDSTPFRMFAKKNTTETTDKPERGE